MASSSTCSSDDETLLALGLIMCANELINPSKKKRKPRSKWARPWIARRETAGAYNALLREIEIEDPRALKNFLRMDRARFNFLLQKLEPVIEKKSTHLREPLPAAEKLALTLRFLASGDSYASLEYLYRIPKNSICRFIPEVCQAIYNLLQPDYLQVPDTQAGWRKIQEDFQEKWQFPHCVGAIDGKHVALKAPENSGSEFYNYKKYFSLILMALVDANCKFIFVDVGANGRAGDATVYANSDLSHALENGTLNLPSASPLAGGTEDVPAVIVGDDAFPLKPFLMKPYPSRNLSYEKRIFNYRLSRARRVSENAFGILASRFCVYRKPLQVSPDVAGKVVLATVALHNFVKSESDPVYINDISLNDTQIPGIRQQAGNRHAARAIQIRDAFADYFMNNGQVAWQQNMVV